MATFTGPRGYANIQPADLGMGFVGFSVPGWIDIAANPVAADIYQLCWVPAGFVCMGGFMYLADIDTHASETVDIDMGWAANGGAHASYDVLDADGLGNFGVMNGDAFAIPSINMVAGNIVPLSGAFLSAGTFPYFSKKTLIQATCVATCATFTAGRLSVKLDGYVDPTLVA